MSCNPVLAVSALLLALGITARADAEVIVFRNVAQTPIRFSIRADNATAPVTQELGVGERISFDLQNTGLFDICAVGLDELNGTFGSSNLALRDLQARMRGNEVEVDGILRSFYVNEGGRIVRRDVRTAVLLKFPIAGCCSPLVLAVGPASKEYQQWFYYDPTPRVR